jgi:DsbC/DsbD-like thiol-disulfide interchange protein
VLKLALEYGVCREVCIPVQPSFALELPAGTSIGPAGSQLLDAIAKIPKDAKSRRPGDPLLKSVKVELTGTKPRIDLAVEFPGGTKGADVFLEAPDGLWIPLPKPLPGNEGVIRAFEVDLTDGADIGDLKGREIRVTLVSDSGQSETSFKLK